MSESRAGWPRAAISLVLVALALGIGVAGFRALRALKQPPARQAPPPPRVAVEVLEAVPARYTEWLRGYAEARLLREVTVASEVAGTVDWVAPELEAGHTVPESWPLVRLEDAALTHVRDGQTAQLTAQRAARARFEHDAASVGRQLAIARTDLEASFRELRRIQRLVEARSVSASALDRQRIQHGALERQVVLLEARQAGLREDRQRLDAAVDQAAAGLARAALDLTHAEVRAPFAGRVAARLVSRGALVGPGTPLFRLVDPARVELRVTLPADRFEDVAVGAPARVRRQGGGPVVWEGLVLRRDATIDPRDRTFAVYLEIGPAPLGAGGSVSDGAAPDDADARSEARGEGSAADRSPDAPVSVVPAGAFCVVEVRGPTRDRVVAIPREALLGSEVLIAVPTGPQSDVAVCERREVTARLLPDVALVHAGLRPRDLVVLTNLASIGAGSEVRIVGRAEVAAEQERRP